MVLWACCGRVRWLPLPSQPSRCRDSLEEVCSPSSQTSMNGSDCISRRTSGEEASVGLHWMLSGALTVKLLNAARVTEGLRAPPDAAAKGRGGDGVVGVSPRQPHG